MGGGLEIEQALLSLVPDRTVWSSVEARQRIGSRIMFIACNGIPVAPLWELGGCQKGMAHNESHGPLLHCAAGLCLARCVDKRQCQSVISYISCLSTALALRYLFASSFVASLPFVSPSLAFFLSLPSPSVVPLVFFASLSSLPSSFFASFSSCACRF